MCWFFAVLGPTLHLEKWKPTKLVKIYIVIGQKRNRLFGILAKQCFLFLKKNLNRVRTTMTFQCCIMIQQPFHRCPCPQHGSLIVSRPRGGIFIFTIVFLSRENPSGIGNACLRNLKELLRFCDHLCSHTICGCNWLVARATSF